MKRISNLINVAAKFNTFFFSWGFYFFSAGSFCCQQNKLEPFGIYV